MPRPGPIAALIGWQVFSLMLLGFSQISSTSDSYSEDDITLLAMARPRVITPKSVAAGRQAAATRVERRVDKLTQINTALPRRRSRMMARTASATRQAARKGGNRNHAA